MCNSVGMNPTAYVAFGVLSEKGWCDREPGWHVSSSLHDGKLGRGGVFGMYSTDGRFITHWYPFPACLPVPEEEKERQNRKIEDYHRRIGTREGKELEEGKDIWV